MCAGIFGGGLPASFKPASRGPTSLSREQLVHGSYSSGESREIQIGHVASNSSLKIRHMASHVTRVLRVGPPADI